MTKVTKVKQEITKQRNIPDGDLTQQQKTNSEKETEPDMETQKRQEYTGTPAKTMNRTKT